MLDRIIPCQSEINALLFVGHGCISHSLCTALTVQRDATHTYHT